MSVSERVRVVEGECHTVTMKQVYQCERCEHKYKSVVVHGERTSFKCDNLVRGQRGEEKVKWCKV